MLSSGYALAGSSYATTGWAIHEALPDQIAVLDKFKKMVGHPKRTIAWGHSLGGIITAGLIQRYPEAFDAALPMCGVLSGGVATWNTALDSEFAFKTLLAPGTGLQIVNIANPVANLELAEGLLAQAQATPQGRARIALAGALADLPGWFVPLSPEPAPTDFAGQETNQFLWNQQVDFPFVFAFRAELEARAQGNVSWNKGVDYRVQLNNSIGRDQVSALYQQAGLDLDADLKTLNETARISADPEAVRYLERNIIFDGEIHIPVLTMHTKGDGLVMVQIARDTVPSHRRKPLPASRPSSIGWIRELGITSTRTTSTMPPQRWGRNSTFSSPYKRQ
jgi:pimeloyl-ACP methyl ester carboxylesterase